MHSLVRALRIAGFGIVQRDFVSGEAEVGVRRARAEVMVRVNGQEERLGPVVRRFVQFLDGVVTPERRRMRACRDRRGPGKEREKSTREHGGFWRGETSEAVRLRCQPRASEDV